MNNTRMKHLLSFILCLALIAAIALTAIGCDQAKTPETPATDGVTAASTEDATAGGTAAETPDPNAPTVKGEGATVFYFNVVDKDGNETKFEIHTDKTIVGEALLELGLIEGEEGAYGLYVKTVNGMTIGDNESAYWALYQNGEYSMTGVDTTAITNGATYALVKEGF